MDFLALIASGPSALSLRDLALVLCVAAVTSVVFQRLKQPVVLGYLLAGIIVGPHTPGVLISDEASLHGLSELGVSLVLFAIGLEFSVRRLFEIGPRPAFVAMFQAGLMLWLGFLAARMLGLDTHASLYVGAMVSISSTVLIQRIFVEIGVERRLQDTVLGVLVYEDLVGILFLAGLTAFAASGDLDAQSIAQTVGRLGLFLAVVIGVGLLVVPRIMRFVLSLRRRETLVIASLGLCFGLALISDRAGYSIALGAFLAGSLAAESGHGEEIHRRTQPVADVFAAIFFVSVGMLVDPALLLEHWVAIVVLTTVVVVGKVFGTALGAFIVGEERLNALRAGISMAQIGEFAFIIAALGVTTGVTPPWVSAVAVGVSTTTAFLTPFLIRNSEHLASAIDRALPERLQTFSTLYSAWLADIRAHGSRDTRWTPVKRYLRVVAIDAAVLGIVVVAGSLGAARLSTWVEATIGVGSRLAWLLVFGTMALCCIPLLLGMIRSSRKLAATLAEMTLPTAHKGSLDLAAAPRRAMIVALQLGVLLCFALPLLAITGPFLPRFSTPFVLLAIAVPLFWVLWRTATNLQGHVRAGAAMIAEALDMDRKATLPTGMDSVHQLLPGLGEITMLGIAPQSPAAGQTLAELDLRGLSGASIVAITRGQERIVMPGGSERLEGGDVIALAGSQEALDQATEILTARA